MQPIKHLAARAAAAALALGLALPALAQQYGQARVPSNLMPEPSSQAVRIALIPAGDRVERLSTDMLGLWWRVRWQGQEGWVSRAYIEKLDASQAAAAAPPPPPAAPATAQRPTAPTAATAPSAAPAPAPAPAVAVPAPTPAPPPAVATAPAAPAVVPAQAVPAVTAAGSRGRAVVFGISDYKIRNVEVLRGVNRDVGSAAAMAQLMGVTPDRITTYREGEVTKDAMAAVLAQLAKEVREGDPVLVYFSGHGSRYPAPNSPGNCVEGLLTADNKVFTSQEMAQLLQPIARVTDGLFVFFDSCFSGGLAATRAIGDRTLKPKFAPRAEFGDLTNCKAVNDLTRRDTATRASGNRYIYAGAARADEMSLDDAENGGLATTNFLNCMVQGNAASLTVDAIRACAQQGIERRLAGETRFSAHHMTITGDVNVRPVRADLSPAVKQQLLAGATEGALANRPSGGTAAKSAYVSSSLVAQGWPQVYNPGQAFGAIAGRSEAGMTLSVEAPRTLRINTQPLRMKVQAPADGFLYIFQATGDGRNAYMLFPNLADQENRVRAGQALDLPRASWPLVAGGPEGDSQLLVVFSRTARDIAQLVGQVDGPFLDLAVSPTGMQALALAISRSAFADEPACQAPTAAGDPACSAAFSATIQTIREVR